MRIGGPPGSRAPSQRPPGQEPFPGSDVSECLHYCVRYLGGISWGLWALAAMVRPEADARLCKKAVARAGLVPFPSCSYVERRSADYEEGVKALHKLWERDGCPDLDRWCRLATVKHGLHLIDAIISALR